MPMKGFEQQNMFYAAQYPQMSFENYAAFQHSQPSQFQYQNLQQYNMGYSGQYNYPQNSYCGFPPGSFQMNSGMPVFGVPQYPVQMNIQPMGMDYSNQFYGAQDNFGYGGFGMHDYPMMQSPFQQNMPTVGTSYDQNFQTTGFYPH